MGGLEVDQQIVNTPQLFPDNTVVGDKISELSVSKLVSGTIRSQQITLGIFATDGDVYIKAGTVDDVAWTATGGFILGLDNSASNVAKFFVGNATSSLDYNVTTADTVTISGAGLVSPIIRFGKTSFSDTVNAGYYISSEGINIGSANDVTVMKYTVATGAYDFIGTISSRSTVTIAATIDASGNVITDLINARLNTSAATILADFDFGATNYAGAVNAGDITWNTTTGAVTGGSGVALYRKGIVGVAAGVVTFSIDAVTGNAIFAGQLSAATGSLGALTVSGAITVGAAGSLSSGQTAYATGTGWWLENNTGTPRFSVGTPTSYFKFDGTNINITGQVFIGDTFNGNTLSFQNIYGDGSNGDVTISGDTSLSSDMFYNNLTINTTKTLNPNGYRIFVKGTLTINGTGKIARNGNAGTNAANGGNASVNTGGTPGSAGTGGAALASGSINGGNEGNDGKVGVSGVTRYTTGVIAGNNGTAGGSYTAVGKVIGSFGVAGMIGSNGGSVTAQYYPTTGGVGGGAGGNQSTSTTVYNIIHNSTAAYLLCDFIPALELFSSSTKGGANGGAGTGGVAVNSVSGNSSQSGGSGGGGGNGGCGAIVSIFAKTIINGGTISSLGGNGGNGGNAGTSYVSGVQGFNAGGSGGGHGGNGGTGGVLIIVYSTLTNNGSISVAGGSGGAGGTASAGVWGVSDSPGYANNGVAGSTGTTGATGKIIYLQV